jgi:dihydroflavonol-4-reductase
VTVLITGGGGFIGSHLVESQLRQGHRVRVVDLHTDLLSPFAGNPRLEVLTGDLTNAALIERAVKDVEVIYHLASAHLDVSASADRYSQVNVTATAQLLAMAKTSGVGRVVHCSSVGVFGELATLPADESTACRPENVYGRTKLAGERAALEFGSRSGLPVVVIRPAWVYGPRCPRTRKLFRAIQRGRFVFVGSGETLRQPLYVTDAIRGFELAAQEATAPGQVYILAGATTVTVRELVHLAAHIVGVRPPRIHIPILPAAALGLALEIGCKAIGREPPFSRRSMEFFLNHNAYDTGKAKRELGFHSQVSLPDGLQRTWRYLKQAQEPAHEAAPPLPVRGVESPANAH